MAGGPYLPTFNGGINVSALKPPGKAQWLALLKRKWPSLLVLHVIFFFLVFHFFYPPRWAVSRQISNTPNTASQSPFYNPVPDTPASGGGEPPKGDLGDAPNHGTSQKNPDRMSREDFVQSISPEQLMIHGLSADTDVAFLSTDVAGQFDGKPLADLCSDAGKWNDRLIIHCDSITGSDGMVRQRLLNCVRLAIEVRGALMLPTLGKLSDSGTFTEEIPMKHIIDEWHFVHILGQFCNGLTIYETIEETPGFNEGAAQLWLELSKLPNLTMRPNRYIAYPQSIRSEFKAWMKRNIPDDQADWPVHVALSQNTSFVWPVDDGPPGLGLNFGRMVRYNEDIRRLAAITLYNLAEKHDLGPDFRPLDGGSPPRTGPLSFAAVNIKTGPDDRDYRFPGYGTQVVYYREHVRGIAAGAVAARQAKKSDRLLPVVYLTCGDASAQADFTRNVAPVPVATKTDLLTAEDLFALMALSDQQRALVDALVAERAGYVLAPDGSTASWALALRRAAGAGAGAGSDGVRGGYCHGAGAGAGEGEGVLARCGVVFEDPEVWRDDLTVIVGNGKSVPANMTEIVKRVWP